MKKTFYFITCCIISQFLVMTLAAQNDSVFRSVKFIPGDYTYLNVDNLDNIYLFTASTGQLKKRTANGDSVGVFNDVKKYGIPAFIDVTNPLKSLLYYPAYSTVLMLDRLLNSRNSINFRKQNIFTVKAIAMSYDNNIWLFDEQDLKLRKIDDEGKPLMETTDWRRLFDTVPSPVQIIDRSNFVYLYDPEKGFYIFDYYGGFKNRLHFLHWTNVEVSGSTMYGFTGDTLHSYQLNSFALKTYKLPAYFSGYRAIKAINGKVYVLKDDGVHIYEVK